MRSAQPSRWRLRPQPYGLAMSRREKRGRRVPQRRPPSNRAGHAKVLASIGLAVGFAGLMWWMLQSERPRPAESQGFPSWLLPCPIGDTPVNLAHFVGTDDGPLFFCCKHCAAKFAAEPGRYQEGAATQRELLQKLPRVQVTCPVSSETVNPTLCAESDGARVCFCSEACRERFLAQPAAYRKAVANSYTYQTRCPLTQDEIDPRIFETLQDGARVYFCSEACRIRFMENPAGWASGLANQGVRLPH